MRLPRGVVLLASGRFPPSRARTTPWLYRQASSHMGDKAILQQLTVSDTTTVVPPSPRAGSENLDKPVASHRKIKLNVLLLLAFLYPEFHGSPIPRIDGAKQRCDQAPRQCAWRGLSVMAWLQQLS